MDLGLKSNAEKIGLIGGILIIIGSMLPWGTGPFGMSASGLEGDGVITYILGIFSIILVGLASWGRKNKIGQPILGILVILIAGNVFLNIMDITLASPGSGLYLTLLGGITLLLLPLIGRMVNNSRTNKTTTELDKANTEGEQPSLSLHEEDEGLRERSKDRKIIQIEIGQIKYRIDLPDHPKKKSQEEDSEDPGEEDEEDEEDVEEDVEIELSDDEKKKIRTLLEDL